MTRWLRQSFVLIFIALACGGASAQTTAFTYQGRLTENGSAATGAFQMQFKLFDALSGGNQIGATADNVPVTVAQGIFTTVLDFGSAPLAGANRWIEIAVRHNSGESYTPLAPREQISSAPYAVRTLSAAMADDAQKLGGVNASQYLTIGSAIRNSSLQQSPANFNISGNGLFGGNVGIGTPLPFNRLDVTDPVRQVRFGSSAGDDGGYLISTNPSQAIVSAGARWDGSVWTARDTKTSLGAFQSGEIGFFADSNLVLGQGFTPTERMKIDAAGNVRQARDKGGLAKAMIYVSYNTFSHELTTRRCYNGMTGADSAGCGFTVVRNSAGFYSINFGFQVDDRFYALTLEDNGTGSTISWVPSQAGNVLTVWMISASGNPTDLGFMVTIY